MIPQIRAINTPNCVIHKFHAPIPWLPIQFKKNETPTMETNTMEQALQALFDAFKQEAPKTKTDQHTDGCTVEKEFSFDLDADGHASLKKSGHGFGKSATCSAWIEAPEDATFSLSIDSNDGDHYHWDNIQTGQNVNFKVHTKTFDSTSVTIELQSTASNVTGTGKLCCNL